MPSERRFRDDGTKTTRFYKPDGGDDQMNENDDDVSHRGILPKLRNLARFANSPPTGSVTRANNIKKPVKLFDLKSLA